MGCRRRVGIVVIAGRDRAAAQLDFADFAVLHRLPGGRVADAHLEAGYRAPEPGEAPDVAVVASAVDRRGVPIGLEHPLVDRVDLHAGARRREGDGERGFRHAEDAERGGRVEPVASTRSEERFDGVRVDRLGAVHCQPPPRQVEPVEASERPGRERVREVGTGRRGAAELGNPFHPSRRRGQEVLRRREHEVEPVQHRRAEQADEPHVVVQRQPRHRSVHVGIEGGGLDGGVEVRGHAAVRHHDALRVGRGAARELEDRQRVRVVGGTLVAARRGAQLLELHDRRVARFGVEELAELRVDHDDLRVGVDDEPAGLGDEVLDRGQPHWQREDYDGGARQPGGLDGRDERTGRSAEQRDVAPRPDAAGLEGGGHGSGVLVETGPLDALAAVGARRSDEGDRVARLCRRLEARQERRGAGH